MPPRPNTRARNQQSRSPLLCWQTFVVTICLLFGHHLLLQTARFKQFQQFRLFLVSSSFFCFKDKMVDVSMLHSAAGCDGGRLKFLVSIFLFFVLSTLLCWRDLAWGWSQFGLVGFWRLTLCGQIRVYLFWSSPSRMYSSTYFFPAYLFLIRFVAQTCSQKRFGLWFPAMWRFGVKKKKSQKIFIQVGPTVGAWTEASC